MVRPEKSETTLETQIESFQAVNNTRTLSLSFRTAKKWYGFSINRSDARVGKVLKALRNWVDAVETSIGKS